MNNAHILAFTYDHEGTISPPHLGAGTITDAFVFDPKTQFTNKFENQINVKRPRNSINRSSSSLTEVSSTSEGDKQRQASRLDAQRQFVYTEIKHILTHNEPQALLIEIYNLVQLLCLNSHSEESRLWEYAVSAISSNVKVVITPKIRSCLEEMQKFLISSHSVTESQDRSANTAGDSELVQKDTFGSNKDSWAKAAQKFHQIMQDMLKSIAILQSLLGPHPTSKKRKGNSLKTEALQRIAETIVTLNVKETLALFLLENLAKQSIDYFIQNINELALKEEPQELLTAITHDDLMSAGSDIETNFVQETDEEETLPISEWSFEEVHTLAILSGGPESIVVQNVCRARDFFVLIFEVGQFCKISESLKETIDVSVISGITNAQKLLRKNRATYVSCTTTNIIQVYRFLNFIKIKSEDINSILRTITWRHLLQDFSEHIEDSISTLILPENWSKLRALIRILVLSDEELSISSSKILLHAWTTYVENETLKHVETAEVVDSILQLRRQLLIIVKHNFQDKRFKSGISTGISKALSPRNVSAKVIHQLSKFCDVGLRQLSKAPTDGTALTNALEVFKLLPDKDTFAQVYARDLSRRLLTSKNCNLRAERHFIDGMIAILGETDCTTRLVAMLDDYSITKLQYQNLDLALGIDSSIQFSAIVLEKKTWPDIPNLKQELIIPSALSEVLKSFQNRYAAENEKKKLHNLDWSNYALHHLNINVKFDSGSKELVLNLFQATVLLAFNCKDTLLVEDLKKCTGLTSQFLLKVLSSLSSSRYPILKLESDKVTFNCAFTDKQSRIRIPMIREKESAIEETKSALSVSRNSQIQAAMVREIKAKGEIPYVVYLATFLERFGWASMGTLKLAIENLITDGYIRRSGNDANLQYLP